MTQKTSPETETYDIARAFTSPVALAFVRIVMVCRGVSEKRARQIYLDYIDRAQPGRAPGSFD
jgi:hypothetical protein